MRKRNRNRNRKQRKPKGPTFIFHPITDNDVPYVTKLSCTRPVPRDLSRDAAADFSKKYGVARIYDENDELLLIEVWMGARKVRHGTAADVSEFMRHYYERQGIASSGDLSDQQMFFGYLSAIFAQLFEEQKAA